MRMTMRELEQTYNRAQGYPYVFLSTEDLSDEFKMSILTMTNAPVYFSKIPSEQWGYPKKKNRVGSIFFGMSEKNKNIDRNLEEEMFKTRYILKFLHDHPVLKNVDYVWRVTPGASYYCALDIDPFLEMKKSKQKYGFVAFSKEMSDSEKFLGNVTEKWISENINNLAEKTMVNWNINDPSAKKRICRFSTSIEIFDTNFLRSSEYDSFMSAIDESGGIFKENWSIDGVRTALISTILKKNDVRWFEEIGYTDDDIRHCPKPHGMALKCVFCKWNKDGPYKSNCYKKFQNLTDIPKLTLLERIKDDEYAFL
ncbi:O-glycoside alpha-1,2-mannosyltransferase-like protein [Zancudomyces culisetae]|uniref:O-glycoside alpha-1,2-mannosyltransferase-like protein n=1 Tax=Zancudomyces culisetae TaxID=1213189 RepID=A0A1R1PR00_ZANCU|nr:O-glycoside alpha-1,2-mannosyltransferase-like protein [Zancudomyces culisetae]|eukprot:OMH83415.1 O-glycoside alpha-1,2-mannosyltransferase-like protein [Zancudomyces culisetae]